MGLGMPTEAEHLRRPRQRLLLGDPLVQDDALGYLAADVHRRVERGQRVLEDHPDVVAAYRPDLVVRHRGELLAGQADRACDRCGRHGGSRRIIDDAVIDLPQPDSPTRPTVSPGSMLRLMPSTAFTTRVRSCI